MVVQNRRPTRSTREPPPASARARAHHRRRASTRRSATSWSPAPSQRSRHRASSYERITVPGALEIPQVLAQAAAAGQFPGHAENGKWDGAVALGCVIRGETAHYDIVCNNANHWLMDVAIKHAIPLGNGILTVDTEAAGTGAGTRRRRRQGRRCGARVSAADRGATRVRGAGRMTHDEQSQAETGQDRIAAAHRGAHGDSAGALPDGSCRHRRQRGDRRVHAACAFHARRDDEAAAGADPTFFADMLRASCAASATSIRWSISSWPRGGASCASTPSCAPSCARGCSS